MRTTRELLPLAGSPRLTIVGREVRLGAGRADLLAIEPSGRVVVIEVKLKDNAEAKQAVVAQVLAYASRLYGLTPGITLGWAPRPLRRTGTTARSDRGVEV